MKKKLYKDKKTGVVNGVLSGFAQYFNIDVKVLRIVFAVVTVLTRTFPLIIVYFVLAMIMPDKSDVGYKDYTVE